MIVRDFKSADARSIKLQPHQEFMADWLDNAQLEHAEKSISKTAEIDGEVVACAGLIEMWEGRAMAWALLSGNCGRHFTAIHRATLDLLNQCGIRRVEATVDGEFYAAHRWLEMLGFSCEGKLIAYSPRGNDCYMYARVMP